ncbi:MAG TPA: alpha/beta hydrolase [Micropepsaceae bacterium]|nr:alpha/beta hydrolase [Micropepsaceae bacterium]
MEKWQNYLPGRVARHLQGHVGHATPVAELRARYDAIFSDFGSTGPEVLVEPTQLGGVKGEWMTIDGSTPQRLIIYLHGGGFVTGSPETHRPIVAKLCEAGNTAAFSVAYRLAPEFPFPAGLRDSVDAYRTLTGRGFPPQSIIVAGDGAGGGLAFSMLMALRNAGLPMPAGIVALSPWADLTLCGWSMMRNAASDSVLSWELLFVSARHYLRGGSAADPYASAVYGSFRDFPPIMVHTGSREILRDDASRLGELAAAANVPVSVEVYEGMQHLFQVLSTVQDGRVSINRMGQFIRARAAETDLSFLFAKLAAR